MICDFVAATERFADERGLDLVRFHTGERKEDREAGMLDHVSVLQAEFSL